MKLSFVYVFAVVLLLLLAGCSSSKPAQSGGVPQNSSQPTGVESAQPPPIKTYSCPDGTIVTSLADCPKCPSSCDDNNPCTNDECGQATGFKCVQTNLDGPQLGCSGTASFCKQNICANGECVLQAETPCCGNGIIESGEACGNCPADVQCSNGTLCCGDGCKKPACTSNKDCDDESASTTDTCSSPGTCDAVCLHSAIVACKSGDGVCPSGCNYLFDTDCTKYVQNSEVKLDIATVLTVDYVSHYRCIFYESVTGEYVAVHVKINNPSAALKSIDLGDDHFTLVKQTNTPSSTYDTIYTPDWYVYGDPCDQSNNYVDISSAEMPLNPGKSTAGILYFDISKEKTSSISQVMLKVKKDSAGDYEVIYLNVPPLSN